MSQLTTQVASRRPRLFEIDLLRIIAALSVVVYHYTFSGYAGELIDISFPSLSLVTRYGYLGVDLFFVISGFVVLLSAWGRRPHEFVISRIVRLYPAFWVALTITAIVSVTLSAGLFDVSLLQYLANLTMFNSLPNVENVDVVYWTLWAEIRFYLIVFVLACVRMSVRRVTNALWIWLGLTFLLQSGLLPGGPAEALGLLVQPQFSHYFIAGMALGMTYRFGRSWELGVIVGIAFGDALYQGVGFADRVGIRYSTELHATAVAGVITAVFAVMTLIALRVTERLGRPWFAILGALTYPLYLIHAHVGFVILNRLGGSVHRYVLVTATIVGMLATAYAIHIFVERPVAPRLKRALTAAAERVPVLRTRDRSSAGQRG